MPPCMAVLPVPCSGHWHSSLCRSASGCSIGNPGISTWNPETGEERHTAEAGGRRGRRCSGRWGACGVCAAPEATDLEQEGRVDLGGGGVRRGSGAAQTGNGDAGQGQRHTGECRRGTQRQGQAGFDQLWWETGLRMSRSAWAGRHSPVWSWAKSTQNGLLVPSALKVPLPSAQHFWPCALGVCQAGAPPPSPPQ